MNLRQPRLGGQGEARIINLCSSAIAPNCPALNPIFFLLLSRLWF